MTKFAPILAVVDQLESQSNARMARLVAAFSEANRGIEPTIDSSGRLHAPCDGYMLTDGHAAACEGDYSDRLFAAGEFLPVPISNEEHFYNREMKLAKLPFYNWNGKAKALVSDIKEFKSLNIWGLIIETGKAWDENGNAVVYAYMEGLKSLVEAAKANFETLYQASKVQGPEVYIEGKQTVTGVILATKIENDERFGASTKMLVQTEDGAKLWGTMPRALPYESQGKRVTFSATFSKGKGGMSYYKRPTCAAIVE